MDSKEKSSGVKGLDPELENLWHDGLDDEQYRLALDKLNMLGMVAVPQQLEAKLRAIPTRMSVRGKGNHWHWKVSPKAWVPVCAVLLLVILVKFVPFKGSRSNDQLAMRADNFLSSIIEDDQITDDIFDDDIKSLEGF